MWRGILVVVLAVATSGGAFLWGRRTIAMPVCEAVARSEGLRLDGYEPIDLGRTNRVTPDGSCRLVRADGRVVTRSLSRHLQRWQHVLSFSLHYDLVFLGAFFGWGVLVAMTTGQFARRTAIAASSGAGP